MKRLNIIFVIAFAVGVFSSALAEEKKDAGINPKPVVTTWSKIKELFE